MAKLAVSLYSRSEEESTMRAIMRQIEEMARNARDKAVQAGAWTAQLEGRVGMEMRTEWATNVAVATRATLGGRGRSTGATRRRR